MVAPSADAATPTSAVMPAPLVLAASATLGRGRLPRSSYGAPDPSFADLISASPQNVLCDSDMSLPIGAGMSSTQQWVFTITSRHRWCGVRQSHDHPG